MNYYSQNNTCTTFVEMKRGNRIMYFIMSLILVVDSLAFQNNNIQKLQRLVQLPLHKNKFNVKSLVIFSSLPPVLHTFTPRRHLGSLPIRDSYNDKGDCEDDESYSVIIGKNSCLNLEGDGTLTFSKSLLVEGKLICRLRCLHDGSTVKTMVDNQQHDASTTKVKVGVEGELQADISCIQNVQVLGIVRGDINCHSLMLGKHASVIGNIVAQDIQIEAGASLIGSIVTGIFKQEQTIMDSAEELPIIEQDDGFGNTQNHDWEKDIYHYQDDEPCTQEQETNVLLQKPRESWIQTLLDEKTKVPPSENFDISTIDWVDDFGKEFITIDPTNGRHVDSFGHPLIRGANQEQVASFREMRNLSKDTWAMIDTHRKQREIKEMLRRSNTNISISKTYYDNIETQSHMSLNRNKNRNNDDGDDGEEEDDDSFPSFLQS